MSERWHNKLFLNAGLELSPLGSSRCHSHGLNVAQLNCETEQNRNNEIKKKKKKNKNSKRVTRKESKITVQPGIALKTLPLPISKRERETREAHNAERAKIQDGRAQA